VGFLYVTAASPECSRVSNVFAHHTTEIGIIFNREGLSMEFEDILLSDNRHGLAPVPTGTESVDYGFVSIKNSAVIGHSDNGGMLIPDASLTLF
jgi:hypothetical protein